MDTSVKYASAGRYDQTDQARVQMPESSEILNSINQKLDYLLAKSDHLHSIASRVCGSRPEAASTATQPQQPAASSLAARLAQVNTYLERITAGLEDSLGRLDQFV